MESWRDAADSEVGERAMERRQGLPMAAYHAAERWHEERIGALALYCSDGRWGEAFDEFCHRHLCIPRYDRWAVVGGPAIVAARPDDPAVRQARIQLDFLVKVHELERIVLITHYGCAWYGHMLGKAPDESLEEQMQDVRAAAATLGAWYPGIEVEGYLAMRERDWLSFHPIEVGSRSGGW
jgi:carbonic anhydrase-like protein